MELKRLKKKFRVGVCGHRDLNKIEIDHYRHQVTDYLQHLVKEYPELEIFIVTSLAEGADRLVVECAVKLGLRYEVILPMDVDIYREDFDDHSKKEFNTLFLNAAGSRSMSLVSNTSLEQIKKEGKERDKQYQSAGYEIVDRSDHMIFLYDGVDNELKGGTADILKYSKKLNKSLCVIKCSRV